MPSVSSPGVTVDGKVAVIIGGTSGIGEAIAKGYAEDGASVVATSRSPERVAQMADHLTERGSPTLEITSDVTKPQTLRDLREQVTAEFGDLDILVNAQSSIARTDLLSSGEEDWQNVFDVQFFGTVRAMKEFAPVLDGGAIINFSSASTSTAIPSLAAYSTAKGAIDVLTKVGARELGPSIRVNAIKPGFVISEQTKGTYTQGQPRFEIIRQRTRHSRLAQPEEMVGAAIYLASDSAAYTTGEILTVDDGFISYTFDE